MGSIVARKILILTADAGFGHRSAANAVAAALQESYGEGCAVEIINPLEDRRAPILLRESQHDYDTLVHRAPELYHIGYEVSDATMPVVLAEGIFTALLYEVMQDIIKRYQPDAILTTYPIYQSPLTAVFTLNRYFIPLLTMITDLATVHRVWYHNQVDACLAPTQIVRDKALEYGFAPEKVHITGIPVSLRLGEHSDNKAALRRELGWQPDLPTFLAVGGVRVEHFIETVDAINHSGAPVQLIVVAGKDAQLFKTLQETEWHIQTHVYDFVDDMPAFMLAADGIICKAGGLIVTEALAAGLPLMLVSAIPGQETGNADYVVAGNAGARVKGPLDALKLITHWLANDRSLLKMQAANAAHLGRPEAARTVAQLIWEAAGRGPRRKERGLAAAEKRLTELLTRHNIPWRADPNTDKHEDAREKTP